MKKQKTEWISATEAVKRLDSSKAVIGRLRKAGKLTSKEDPKSVKGRLKYLLKWPEIVNQFKEAQEKKRKMVGRPALRPHFDWENKDHDGLSDTEKIVMAIEIGAKNAPDLAYHYAKGLQEQVKARIASIKLLEAEGKTLIKEDVENFIFTISRQNRDIWRNWPEQVSVRMAEELGIDTKKCNDVLNKYVREQLERNATLPIQYAGISSGDIPAGADASTGSDS